MQQVLRSRAVRIALAAALAGGLAPAVVAAVPDRGDEPVGAPGSRVAQAADVSNAVKDKVRVFRTAATPDDVPTVGAVEAEAGGPAGADVDADFARSNGMNTAAARRLSATQRVFAVPGRGVTCLLTGKGAASCTPDEHVGRDFQVQACGSLPPGVVSVSGLVDDTAERIGVRRRDGSIQPVQARRSFADARLRVQSEADLPVAVVLQGAQGTASVALSALSMEELACAASAR